MRWSSHCRFAFKVRVYVCASPCQNSQEITLNYVTFTSRQQLTCSFEIATIFFFAFLVDSLALLFVLKIHTSSDDLSPWLLYSYPFPCCREYRHVQQLRIQLGSNDQYISFHPLSFTSPLHSPPQFDQKPRFRRIRRLLSLHVSNYLSSHYEYFVLFWCLCRWSISEACPKRASKPFCIQVS